MWQNEQNDANREESRKLDIEREEGIASVPKVASRYP